MKNKVRLSSSATFLYKIIIPGIIVIFNLLLIVAALFLLPKRYADLYVVLVPFSIIVSSVTVALLIRLKEVFLEQDELLIDGKLRIPVTSVKAVNRYLFYFFEINYKNEVGGLSHILVMPRIREFVVSMGLGKIKSFEILKHKIEL